LQVRGVRQRHTLLHTREKLSLSRKSSLQMALAADKALATQVALRAHNMKVIL
jgi:hypothetical protein